MKISKAEAAQFLIKPDLSRAGALLFGPDAMRIALKRQDALKAALGPNSSEEMRLTRMTGAELRKDPAALLDAIKAQGFFPGPRAVLVEDATDGLALIFSTAFEAWQEGDAFIMATAGQLNARSALRKVFEGSKTGIAIGIYDDPPSREMIEAELAKAGLASVSGSALDDLTALARTLDPGDFRQTLEKLSLYKLGDAEPVSGADIEACAPATSEAALDDAIHFAAEGQVAALGPQMQRLAGQGTNPTTLCISATRHFRLLHTASADPQGPEAALGRSRPPVFGPRRDRMVRQARHWGLPRLEMILTILTDTDLTLRSSSPAPAMAVVERAFIRIAMMHQR